MATKTSWVNHSRISSLKPDVKGEEMTKNGLIMVIFVVLTNFFYYVYQLSMGLLLTPEQYSILCSLTSLLIILQVMSQTITTTIAKFTSKLKAEKKMAEINYLWSYALKKSIVVGITLFTLFTILSPIISRFLNLDNLAYPIILFSSMIFTLMLAVNWGIFQGLQKFWVFGSSQTIASFLRFGIAVLLVYLGSGIYGALAAIPVSFILILLITLIPFRTSSNSGFKKTTSAMYSYVWLALLSIFAITVLTNADMILVRHYLSATEAGNYSAISVLGRITFYVPGGIALALFPKTSELFETGAKSYRLLKKAMLYTLLLVGSVILVYRFFPEFIINFLFGSKYPFVAPYLFKYSLAMGLFAISYLLMNYLLSLNRTKVVYPLLGTMLLELGLIVLFHSTISQVVNIMLISGGACMVFVVLFYLKMDKNEVPIQ
jgi:O-antigen/teichoic acid export membrane protein